MLLLKKPGSGLVLKMEFPQPAIFTVDPETGKKIPAETNPVVTIRDHDLDGFPDDFNLNLPEKPVYKEEVTKEEFINFRETEEHEGILIQWSMGIGFSINHFLHGIDSAMPR